MNPGGTRVTPVLARAPTQSGEGPIGVRILLPSPVLIREARTAGGLIRTGEVPTKNLLIYSTPGHACVLP